MKTVLRVLLSLVILLAVMVAIAYADGATLPINHSISVSGIVPGSPASTFAIISNVADGASWRSEVKSVKMLPQNNGNEQWIEDLGHGTTMDFLVIRAAAPSAEYLASQHTPDEARIVAMREVRLDDPGASYGGTWLYQMSETSSNDGQRATLLKITESGYINPPIYRFMMAHIFGPTRNLDIYLHDIQKKAANP